MLSIVTKKSSNLAKCEKKGEVQAPIIQSKGTIAMRRQEVATQRET
jgi:hypothetical protein